MPIERPAARPRNLSRSLNAVAPPAASWANAVAVTSMVNSAAPTDIRTFTNVFISSPPNPLVMSASFVSVVVVIAVLRLHRALDIHHRQQAEDHRLNNDKADTENEEGHRHDQRHQEEER